MIIFKNVTKKFGSQKVLSKVSFEVKPQEFVFLVGPSGAGKTTLIRLIIHDLVPTSGKIFVADWDVTSLAARKIPLLRRKIGVVFQDLKILFDKTVLENVSLVEEILGKNLSEAREEASKALALVELKGKENFFPVQLSAGELQRVCIARAIVGKPQVLLADEPTGNLDPATAWGVVKLLEKINKMGTTVLMATHNVDIVNSLRRRVIGLKKGRIVKNIKEGRYRDGSF